MTKSTEMHEHIITDRSTKAQKHRNTEVQRDRRTEA